jgi:hypothetical protein
MENRYGKPTQLISKAAAKQLYLNYDKTRANVIEKAIGREDANATWYSLEELENYINYIKTTGKQKGYNVDGIRFYFGVYPDNEKDQSKAGLSTIFLVPTGTKEKASLQKKALSAVAAAPEEPQNIMALAPMNYGSIGHPPKMTI